MDSLPGHGSEMSPHRSFDLVGGRVGSGVDHSEDGQPLRRGVKSRPVEEIHWILVRPSHGRQARGNLDTFQI